MPEAIKRRRVRGQMGIDVLEASELTGFTQPALRARVRRNLIPYRRIGGRVLFSREELAAWWKAQPGCSLEQARANLKARRAT
jgi:excisionase family DNA binding protein